MNDEEKIEGEPRIDIVNATAKSGTTIAVPRYLVVLSLLLLGGILLFGVSLAVGRNLGLRPKQRGMMPYSERYKEAGQRDLDDDCGRGKSCPRFDDKERTQPSDQTNGTSTGFACPNCQR